MKKGDITMKIELIVVVSMILSVDNNEWRDVCNGDGDGGDDNEGMNFCDNNDSGDDIEGRDVCDGDDDSGDDNEGRDVCDDKKDNNNRGDSDKST